MAISLSNKAVLFQSLKLSSIESSQDSDRKLTRLHIYVFLVPVGIKLGIRNVRIPPDSYWSQQNQLRNNHSPYLAVNHISPTLRDSIYELQSHIGIVRRMPVSSLRGLLPLETDTGSGLTKIAKDMNLHSNMLTHPSPSLSVQTNKKTQ